MPIKSTGYDHLYEFSGPVGSDEIEALVGDGAIRTLQTAQTDVKQTLALLDASFFARLFRQPTGLSPNLYRRQLQQKDS